jgi:hypothetical protein
VGILRLFVFCFQWKVDTASLQVYSNTHYIDQTKSRGAPTSGYASRHDRPIKCLFPRSYLGFAGPLYFARYSCTPRLAAVSCCGLRGGCHHRQMASCAAAAVVSGVNCGGWPWLVLLHADSPFAFCGSMLRTRAFVHRRTALRHFFAASQTLMVGICYISFHFLCFSAIVAPSPLALYDAQYTRSRLHIHTFLGRKSRPLPYRSSSCDVGMLRACECC